MSPKPPPPPSPPLLSLSRSESCGSTNSNRNRTICSHFLLIVTVHIMELFFFEENQTRAHLMRSCVMCVYVYVCAVCAVHSNWPILSIYFPLHLKLTFSAKNESNFDCSRWWASYHRCTHALNCRRLQLKWLSIARLRIYFTVAIAVMSTMPIERMSALVALFR